MSRFFPKSEYAEDQPLAKTILGAHVIYRGFQTGAVLGVFGGAARYAFATSRQRRQQRPLNQHVGGGGGIPVTAAPRLGLVPTLTGAAAHGGVVGAILLTVMLPFYMKDQTEIQWQDRSWRILANRGQVETDDWTLLGTIAGAASSVSSAASVSTASLPAWQILVGRAAIGNVAGLVGYMTWRYGFHGGKR